MTLPLRFKVDPRIGQLHAEIRQVIGEMLEKVDIDSKAGQFTLRRIRAETNEYVGKNFDTVEQEVAALQTALEGLRMWSAAMQPVILH